MLITGKICGYRIEDIETLLTRQVRYLDKLVDELAQGKPMNKILRANCNAAAATKKAAPQLKPKRSRADVSMSDVESSKSQGQHDVPSPRRSKLSRVAKGL
jgi:hypothetical protein